MSYKRTTFIRSKVLGQMEKFWLFKILFISSAFTSLGIISASKNVNAGNYLQTEMYDHQTKNNTSKIVAIFKDVNLVGKSSTQEPIR